MKSVMIIARIPLGAIFVFFGADQLYPFMHPEMPSGAAGQMLIGLTAAHFVILIGLVQFVGGLLMLIGQYVALGLVLLGPMIVCIDYFHVTVAPSGLPMAAVVTLLWLIVAWSHKHHLAGIFSRTA